MTRPTAMGPGAIPQKRQGLQRPVTKGYNTPRPSVPKRINPADFAKLGNPFENFIAIAVLLGIALIYTLCALFWDETIYTPEEGLGYYMGMVGGIIMLCAYLYGLRKYVPGLRSLGKLKHWLKTHIFLGILGPVLVMTHSTFNIGSLNGGMALISMLLVVVSGVMGRYLYTKVHFGLYGRKAQLKEVQQVLWLRQSGIKSRLSMTPRMTRLIHQYEKSVITSSHHMGQALFALVSIYFRTRWLYYVLGKEMTGYLKMAGRSKGMTGRTLNRRIRYARRMLWFYVHTIGKVVQFSAFERLLSLWRMLHVPLLYLLFISGVVHVIAVHMY